MYLLIVSVLRFIVGGIGNILVLTIYRFSTDDNSQGFYISLLALADLSATFLQLGVPISRYTEATTSNRTLCKMYGFSFGLPGCLSAIILFVIAVDRYLKICKHNNILTRWRILVAVVSFFTVLLAVIPKVLMTDIVDFEYANVTKRTCMVKNDYRSYYGLTLLSICICMILTMSVFYVQIIRTIQKHFIRNEKSHQNHLWQNTMKSESDRFSKRNIRVMKKMSIIFIIVSITFFVSYIPFLCVFISGFMEGWFTVIFHMYNIGSLTNPYVFLCMDPRCRIKIKSYWQTCTSCPTSKDEIV